MPERTDYDDDPADTAAVRWLKTMVGKRTIELAAALPVNALRRAFRSGFLVGSKAERKKTEATEPTED